jgi:hypothetical protein
MSEIDINSLPYPMFKTTPEEKEILRKCLPVLKNGADFYLCVILTFHGVGHTKDLDSLKDKIQGILHPSLGLRNYIKSKLTLSFNDDFSISSYELRIVWINKLLEYTGE